MITKPAKGRATIKRDFNSFIIEIPSRKNWFYIIFSTVWMGGWVMGEISVLKIIFRSGTPVFADAFLLFWLVGWTVGGAFAIYTILWQLIGRELIVIEGGVMKIEKSVIGIGRKRSYGIRSIKNLNINPTQNMGGLAGSFSWRISGKESGKIKFDYGMKTVKFANDIDEAEARMILEKLKGNIYFHDENFAYRKT